MSQLGRPRSVCITESRTCHVTSHRVFVWGHTAFDTLSLHYLLLALGLLEKKEEEEDEQFCMGSDNAF